MNNLEEAFEKYALAQFRVYNFYVKKMNVQNDSGFPDLWIEKKDKKALIELKVISVFNRSKKIKPLFQKSQIPWYKDYLNKSGSKNLFLILKAFEASDKFYHLIKIDPVFLSNLDMITYQTLEIYCLYPYCKTAKFSNIVRILESYIGNILIVYES